MDGYQAYDIDQSGRSDLAHFGPADRKRAFLFLQGPISTFFDRLGRVLIARGHRVYRVNLHLGDRLFWHLPATHFRGRFEDWRQFVGALMDEHRITDLVVHGDRRPYHIVAGEEARARGIAVIATDLGYLRPDWITLEYDGMTTYSRFPRDPAAIRALAATVPQPELGPRFHTPFWLIAALDVVYNLGLVLGRPLYPHYRYHSTCHPFAEYAGWLWSCPKKFLGARAAAAARQRLLANSGSYFLVPLQISTDFQIRAHSRFSDVRDAVRTIIASFATSGSERKLVFVVHPLDNGLIGWHRFIARLARHHGIGAQAQVIDGGTPIELLRAAAGVVTINSTVGVTALHHGVPVKVLGNAVFDVPGLTCQAPLAAFWRDPPLPDRALMTAFARALAGSTQVKGGYYERRSQNAAIGGFVARLERGLHPLPPAIAQLAVRPPRGATRNVAICGVAGAVGMALARVLAAPGVRLHLIGSRAEAIDRAAEDCRRRGAIVDTCCLAGNGRSSLAEYRAACATGGPVDLLVALADPTAEHGGQDMLTMMEAVAAVAEAMRRRASGEIVLVGGQVGRAIVGDATTARYVRALRAFGEGLRRRLGRHGIAVTVAVPSAVAWRAAGWCGDPSVAAVTADRIAARIVGGHGQRAAVITLPGVATAGLRALRVMPARAIEMVRNLLAPGVAAMGQGADDASLPGETGSGD